MKTPKLYFYDVGLVCALLGIAEPAHLRTHPLRGALFENWVVSEVMKWRTHRGLPWTGYFVRDRKGFEVDLLLEAGDRLLAAEVKSGQTVAADFFHRVRRLEEQVAQGLGGREVEKRVVFGGDRRERRDAIEVVPWSDVATLSW